jgi:hypothetical protein
MLLHILLCLVKDQATLAPMNVNSCCCFTNLHFLIKLFYLYVGNGLLLIGNYGMSYVEISGYQRIKEMKKTTRNNTLKSGEFHMQ